MDDLKEQVQVVEPKAKPTDIPQEVLDEALIPSLSKEFFDITFERNGQTIKERVQLKPLRFKHSARISQLMENILSEVIHRIEIGQHGQALVMALKHFSDAAEIIAVICQNDGKDITSEDVMESDLNHQKVGEIIFSYIMKVKHIEVAVRDYFLPVFNTFKQKAEEEKAKAMELIQTAKVVDSISDHTA